MSLTAGCAGAARRLQEGCWPTLTPPMPTRGNFGWHRGGRRRIEVELEQMAKYDEQIAVLKKYFAHEEESPGYSI